MGKKSKRNRNGKGNCIQYYDPEEVDQASVRRGIIEKHDGDGLSENQFKFVAFNYDDFDYSQKIGNRIVDVKDIFPNIHHTVLRFSEDDTGIARSIWSLKDVWDCCTIAKVFPRPHPIGCPIIYPFYAC